MRTMEFEWVEDRDWGDGWRATCHHHFNAQREAQGIVHDFIDHGAPTNYHTFEGELMAFGSIIYSRGRFGTRMGNPERDLPREMAGFLTGAWYAADDCRLEDTIGLPDLLDDEDEATIRRYARATMKELIGELAHMGWAYYGTPPSLAELVKCRRRIHAWLREGWQQALQRFPTLSAPRLAEAFEELVEIVRDQIRNLDESYGAILKLHIDEDGTPSAELIEPEPEFEEEEEEEEEFA